MGVSLFIGFDLRWGLHDSVIICVYLRMEPESMLLFFFEGGYSGRCRNVAGEGAVAVVDVVPLLRINCLSLLLLLLLFPRK